MPDLDAQPAGQEDLRVAQQVAQELNQRGVDVNEAHKTLRFLSTHPSGPRFFAFLRTLQQNAGVVVRSQQTLAYYDAIREVCERHLRPYRDEPQRMAQVLGWAIRLMPYYRLEPHLPQPQAPQITPAASTPVGSAQPTARPARGGPTSPRWRPTPRVWRICTRA